MRRSYKYRIYLNKAQREALVNSFHFCKNLYNAALEERISYAAINVRRLGTSLAAPANKTAGNFRSLAL